MARLKILNFFKNKFTIYLKMIIFKKLNTNKLWIIIVKN